MSPSQLRLFTAKEQSLLVSTEPKRLEQLSEDELADLLGRVRRLRGKYSDLHRTQGRKSVESSGKRYAAATSNERTLQKAEAVEDCLSRVARYLSRAARANANDLKAARLAAARANTSGGAAAPARAVSKKAASSTSAKKPRSKVSGARVGSTSARNKKNQAAADGRKPTKK